MRWPIFDTHGQELQLRKETSKAPELTRLKALISSLSIVYCYIRRCLSFSSRIVTHAFFSGTLVAKAFKTLKSSTYWMGWSIEIQFFFFFHGHVMRCLKMPSPFFFDAFFKLLESRVPFDGPLHMARRLWNAQHVMPTTPSQRPLFTRT